MKLILAMLLLFSAYASASCNSINDQEQRKYCEARKGSSCASINDSDVRTMCEGEKGGSCASINDLD
jgi:hypothetical protein